MTKQQKVTGAQLEAAAKLYDDACLNFNAVERDEMKLAKKKYELSVQLDDIGALIDFKVDEQSAAGDALRDLLDKFWDQRVTT